MGRRSESQFHYWDLRRRGSSQSEISKVYSVSRQAVSKSIQAQENNVEYRLLEFAESSGILVEWYDRSRGILIGIIPPLDDMLCIIMIDRKNRIRVHYDPESIKGRSKREKAWDRLRSDLRSFLGSDLDLKRDTRSIVDMIISLGGIRK
ncbi:MAG: hypothetical protein QCI82_03700 [Candidatus Thermoplasmatota archaeon]|nr:hypothetical protein [Candidatus Thermoplasmatota archaeon]